MKMGSVDAFIHRKLVLFAAFFWAAVSTLFESLSRNFFRITWNYCSQTINSNRYELNSDCAEKEVKAKKPEVDVTKFKVSETKNDLEEEEEETPKFFFKFEFQTCTENYDYDPVRTKSESLPSANTSKYEFSSGKNFSQYLEKPEAVSFTVKEFYADGNGVYVSNEEKIENGFSSDEEFVEQKSEAESVQKRLKKKPMDKDYVESDSDSITSIHTFSTHFAASTSDGFSSDKDIGDPLRDVNEENLEISDEGSTMVDVNLRNSSAGYDRSDSMKELQQHNFNKKEHSHHAKQSKREETSENSQNFPGSDCEDSNRLETLWEHQELIEQLQMELRKVKEMGLGTVLEEDECPKVMEDLKPWKIDEEFQEEEKMGELHNFCRSYRECMRKLDFLNYQKMYAIGFLQPKEVDQLQSLPTQKPSPSPPLTSLLPPKLLPCKNNKNSGFNPTLNSFIRELHGDLEMVYVGQMCLSWELLRWQYEKAMEIWESDPYLVRRYNEVAGEFQRFQVVLQRFIEDEPFERRPRVHYYVKNRCVLRNLLQVPVIREDSVKDEKGRRKGRDDHTITSEMLVEIMEESIRIFWLFIQADNDAHNVTYKARKRTPFEPQEQLLTEVRTSLCKKEKKLKDILRSGKWIVRRFQKQQREGSDEVLYFISKVDMKLVSRVLNMSKITMEQLLWCHNKLSNINFERHKLCVEPPSFLLFPC